MWTWDPAKSASNLRKHGISFKLAVRVFDDPGQVIVADDHEDGDRWRTIGRPSLNTVVLFVVHTEALADGGTGRIISARLATRSEVNTYYENQRRTT